jgi:diacylglycerol kinase (ATP)
MPNLYRGTHVRNPAVSVYRARQVEINGEGTTHVHLDGEPFGTIPLSVKLVPGSLEVATNPVEAAEPARTRSR